VAKFIFFIFNHTTRSLADESRWLVRLGVFSRASATFEPYYQEFKVKKIIQHPDFEPNTMKNDIALMFVDGVIQESKKSMYKLSYNFASALPREDPG
jgi:hypothetical protein